MQTRESSFNKSPIDTLLVLDCVTCAFTCADSFMHLVKVYSLYRKSSCTVTFHWRCIIFSLKSHRDKVPELTPLGILYGKLPETSLHQ